MTDQCKGCCIRGDIERCRSTDCFQHDNWYAVKQQQEIDQLKANFEDMRNRNAVLRQRPDLPVDRMPAIEIIEQQKQAIEKLMEKLDKLAESMQ